MTRATTKIKRKINSSTWRNVSIYPKQWQDIHAHGQKACRTWNKMNRYERKGKLKDDYRHERRWQTLGNKEQCQAITPTKRKRLKGHDRQRKHEDRRWKGMTEHGSTWEKTIGEHGTTISINEQHGQTDECGNMKDK